MIGVIKKKISSFLEEGSFKKNFLYIFSSSAIGLLIQVIFTPIIARIYQPEDYGIYSTLVAFTSNLLILSTFRLEAAFVLPKTTEKFYELLDATFTLAVSTLAICTVLIFVGGNRILSLFDLQVLAEYNYLVPAFIFIYLVNTIRSSWSIRAKAYRHTASLSVTTNLLNRFFTLGYGWFTKGAFLGLILGDLLSKLAFNFLFYRINSRFKEPFRFRFIGKEKLFNVLKEYGDFPKYEMTGNFFNLISGQLPIYFFAANFGMNYVGQFGFATSLLDIPMRLIGNSTSTVFLQKVAELENSRENDKLAKTVKKLYQNLLYVGLIPILILTVFGDLIFQVFFGSQWQVAGIFASYLGFYYLFRLISTPLTGVLTVKRKNKARLVFQIIIIIGRVLSLLLGIYIFNSPYISIICFSAFNILFYLSTSAYILKVAGLQYIPLLLKSCILVTISTAALYLVRHLALYQL